MQNYNETEQSVSATERKKVIWHEQMRLIDRNARLSNYVSFLVALFVAYTFWGNESTELMLGWLGFMALLTLVRALISISLDRQSVKAGKTGETDRTDRTDKKNPAKGQVEVQSPLDARQKVAAHLPAR